MCGRRLAEPLNPRAVQGAVPTTTRTSPTPPQATGLVADPRFRVTERVLRDVNASGGRPVRT